MNPDTRVCRRCIDAVKFRGLARGHWLRRFRAGIFGAPRHPLRAWWQEAGIDPVKAAWKLWNSSRMDQGVCIGAVLTATTG